MEELKGYGEHAKEVMVASDNAPAIKPKDGGFMSVIEKLSMMPDIPVEKIAQLMDMQEHVLDRQAEKEFNADMVLAQSEMPIVPRDKKNNQTHSKYSSYEITLKYTKPVYTKYGFAVSYYEGKADDSGEIRIFADVMHRGGHTKTYFVDIPLDNKGIKGTVNKTNTHAKVSSISYGRSALIKMIFNIPTGNDDDGNAAGGVIYIDDKQKSQIIDMINAKNINEDAFLKHMKAESVDAIPAKLFGKAMTALKKAKGNPDGNN